MHGFSVDLVSSTSDREEPLVQQFVALDDMQSSPRVYPLPVETDLLTDLEWLKHNDSLAIVTQVVGPDVDGNMVLVVHENTHNSPRIQHDLELWHHVHEYDAKTSEMSFTPILSKKRKQQVKKQFHVGKPPY